jgi:hypothetical protein
VGELAPAVLISTARPGDDAAGIRGLAEAQHVAGNALIGRTSSPLSAK